MTAFANVEREIIADIDGLKGREASLAIAQLAGEARDRVIAEDHPSSTTQFVDGVEGAALETVKPDGLIRFEFGYLDEIVRAILAMVVELSPFLAKRPGANPSTHYRDEHAVFIDGAEVTELPAQIPATAEVVITNLQPYARKVEQGFGPGKKAAHGVYQAVARRAKSQYGNQVKIQYSWREFPGAGPKGPKVRKGGAATHRHDDSFPSITVTAL